MYDGIFIIDYRHSVLSEILPGKRTLTAYLRVALIKLSRFNSPGSTDDLPVPSLVPLQVDALPDDLQRQLAALETDMLAQGFHAPVRHVLDDSVNKTTTALVTFVHPSGAVGRVHLRLWHLFRPPRVKLFAEIISPLRDGGFLWTLSGKPDMLAPAACAIQREITATPEALWTLHQKHPAFGSALRVTNQRQLIACVDKLQGILWEFHTRRGIFRPATLGEIALLKRSDEIAGPKPDGTLWRHPAVLNTIEMLQNQKSSWASAVWLLVISLVLFVTLGTGGWSWHDYVYVIPILFFHELGHYLTMRWFGYKNLKLFFIPFFGAAVSGKNYNVSAWKQVIVSLMGPLPGIVVGIGMGLLALSRHNDAVLRVANLAIIINAFNLLPVMPLDGGRIMHALVFSRHPIADVTFRVLASAALIGGGFYLGSGLLTVGVLMLLGLSAAWRLARVTHELRRSGVAGASADGQSIPLELAETIVDRIIAHSPKRPQVSILARNTLTVFESLNARPPGWLATMSLLSLHGATVAGAVVFGAIFFLAHARAQRDLLREISGAPPHWVPSDGGQHVPPVTGTDPVGRHISVIATLDSPEAVGRLREKWRPALSKAAMTTFGDTFIITVGPEYSEWANDMFKRLGTAYPDVYVEDAGHPSHVLLEGEVAGEADGKAICDELNDYFAVKYLDSAMAAPWSVGADITEAQYHAALAARHTYASIGDIVTDGFHANMEVAALDARIQEAIEGKDESTRRSLELERDTLVQKLRRQSLEGLRANAALDQVLLEGFLATSQTTSSPPVLPAPLTDRLGLIGDASSPVARAKLARNGYAINIETEVSIQLDVVNFAFAIPAATQWLHAHHVSHLSYHVYAASEDANPR